VSDVPTGRFAAVSRRALHPPVREARLLLTLAFGNGSLCLSVTDDGHGFDPSALDGQLPAGRLGLLGMRERAALAGGRLTIQSAPGQGTTVEATFATEQAPAEEKPSSGAPPTPT
jgi:nitrate/nitrite-specific signal transduction histidine kinase